MIIILDDENRENEGDLCLGAQFVNPSKITYMLRYGSGMICVSLKDSRLKELEIPDMAGTNNSKFDEAMTTSVDFVKGMESGVSATDRSNTVRALIEPSTKAHELLRPGHVFPLRAKDGGLMQRQGHTEAGINVVELAGLYPASVITELMNDDGTMMRGRELEEFSKKHNIKMVIIPEIIDYLKDNNLINSKSLSATAKI